MTKNRNKERGSPPRAPAGRPETGHPPQDEVFLGIAEDYLSHLEVLILTLKASLSTRDMIHIKGHSTNIIQPVDSIQIDHRPVQEAYADQCIGIKCACLARRGDKVYRICPS